MSSPSSHAESLLKCNVNKNSDDGDKFSSSSSVGHSNQLGTLSSTTLQEIPPLARILTVGEGDLSYSLALSRVFGGKRGHHNTTNTFSRGRQGIEIVATTLPNRLELEQTYNSALSNINELNEKWNQTILHEIDATRLHEQLYKEEEEHQQPSKFDAIVFSHPHLGLHDLQDEATHALKHSILIGHFLYSAKQLLLKQYYRNNARPNATTTSNTSFSSIGTIHLTLCGTQPQTWNLHQHARRHNLKLIRQREPTSMYAFLPLGCDGSIGCNGDSKTQNSSKEEEEMVENIRVEANIQASRSSWSARRKFRSGALGSKHWLGKFGYEHRRTAGDQDMKVDRSIEFVYQVIVDSHSEHDDVNNDNQIHENVCPICNYALQDDDDKKNDAMKHVREMAIPVVINSPASSSTIKETATTFPVSNNKDDTSSKGSTKIVGRWKCNITGRTFATEYALHSFREQQKAQPNSLKRQYTPHEQLLDDSNKNNTEKPNISSANTADADSVANQSHDGQQQKRVQHIVPSSPSSSSLSNIRAKQYVRKVAFPTLLTTKKIAHAAFTEKRVLLNEEVIEESRFIKPSDVLILVLPKSDMDCSSANSGGIVTNTSTSRDDEGNLNYGSISIQWSREDAAIVWKPCGIRCKGPFDGTLQSSLRSLLKPTILMQAPSIFHSSINGNDPQPGKKKKNPKQFKDCIPLSRLEIGCSGLCLVARSKISLDRLEELDKQGGICYTFIALVYGRLSSVTTNDTFDTQEEEQEEWTKGRILNLPQDLTKRMKRDRKRQRNDEQQINVTIKSGTPAFAIDAAQNNTLSTPVCPQKILKKNVHDVINYEMENEDAVGSKEKAQKTDNGKDTLNSSSTPNDTMTAKLISATAEDSPVHLSTLRITSTARSGRLFGDICSILRKCNHAVVGDKFARRDQQASTTSLPRYCSPISKGKVQLRCLGIAVMEEKIDFQLDVPIRMMASTWSSAETAAAAKHI